MILCSLNKIPQHCKCCGANAAELSIANAAELSAPIFIFCKHHFPRLHPGLFDSAPLEPFMIQN